MPKKTSFDQKEEAKVIVKECILRRLSRTETVNVLNDRLNVNQKRKKITIWDVDRIKRSLKNEAKTWMRAMLKTRYAYVLQYKQRVDEYLNYQKQYWHLFNKNPDKPFLQKACIDSLQNTSAALTQLYDILPEIVGQNYLDGHENVLSKSPGKEECADNKGFRTNIIDSEKRESDLTKDPSTDSPPCF